MPYSVFESSAILFRITPKKRDLRCRIKSTFRLVFILILICRDSLKCLVYFGAVCLAFLFGKYTSLAKPDIVQGKS